MLALPFVQRALGDPSAMVNVFEAAAIVAHAALLPLLDAFAFKCEVDWVGELIADAIVACQSGDLTHNTHVDASFRTPFCPVVLPDQGCSAIWLRGAAEGRAMVFMQRAVLLTYVVLIALGLLYAATELMRDRNVRIDLPAIRAATAPADFAEGARLARILGCVMCHGTQGRVLLDRVGAGRVIAPALAEVADKGSDEQLARAIRHGLSVDAQSLYVMPVGAYNQLADQDVARLVGWMRTLKIAAKDRVGGVHPGIVRRVAMLIGGFPSEVTSKLGQPKTRPAYVGSYFSAAACMGCHAIDHDRVAPPAEVIAPALRPAVMRYDAEALRTLLRTGRGRHSVAVLPVMGAAARAGLGDLTEAEIDAIRHDLRGAGAGEGDD